MKEKWGKHGIMRILVRNNWRHTQKAIMLLDVFFALFLVCSVLAMTMSVFAIFSYYTTALFYTVQLFSFIGIAVSNGYGTEQIAYMVMPVVFSVVIAVFRYYQETKHIGDRISLESIIEEAETDALTGLLNRRGLTRNIETVWPYCQRGAQKVSVLMLDIDYFKLYNDTFGHPQGDVCIQRIGSAILQSIRRRTDFAARIGGEEFLIFMPGISGTDAVEWANCLKDNIALLGIRHSHNAPFANVTVSIGMMSYDTCRGMTFEDMKEQVDECLYMAKNNGRNCICANGRLYEVSESVQWVI